MTPETPDNNTIYIYDGSLDGLLTCVFEVFERKEYDAVISKAGDVQLTIGAEIKEISTDAAKAERVYKGIVQKIGSEALRSAYYATLSSEPDAETAALNFLRVAFKRGHKISGDLADPRVWRMHQISRGVDREKYRYIEFLRFSELEGGILFAEFEPAPNVLPLIMPHFADRLTSLPFIIHDKRRLIAGVYDTKEWLLISSADMNLPQFSSDENECRELWRLFFNTIAVKERINPRLQMQLMPKKYWEYMTEMQK